MEVWVFICVALFGLLIGILSGMFGIGGGTVMIPALNLVFGLPILSSTATSLFVIAPTSISATIRNLRTKTIRIKTALTIGMSGALASAASSYVSDSMPALAITIATVVVIVYSAFEMLRSIFKADKGEKNASSDRTDSSAEPKRENPALCIGLGVFAGAVAGVVGVGGGFIIVPITIMYFGYEFKMASATSLLAIAIIAIPGIVVHALLGHVEYLYGLALMLGSVPGANIGSRLIAKFPEKIARILFSLVLLVSGVLLIIRNIG